MNDQTYTQSQTDFTQSQYSQLSKYELQVKGQRFNEGEKLMNDSVIDTSLLERPVFDILQVSKKLYVKDLQVNKQTPEVTKTLGKQNNIPNQTQDSNVQSRKITIYKNNSLSPYRHIQNMGVDESFTTSKIVQLQQELINLRKQMSHRQSSWIKQKSILLNKIQISNFDVAQMKQRNANLIQINQTLTQALGQTNRNSNTHDNDRKREQIIKQLNEKTKTTIQLQDKLSKIQKEKLNVSLKLQQQKQKTEFLTKNLEEYRTILGQSNQRKLQADEKMVVFVKNVRIVKKGLRSLPIKDQYLRPIYAFLDAMEDCQSEICNQDQSCCYKEAADGQLYKQKQFRAQKSNKYGQESQYLQPEINSRNKQFIQDERICDSDYYCNDESYNDSAAETNKKCPPNYYLNKQKCNKNYKLFNQTHRIDTQQNYYHNQLGQQSHREQQQEGEVYLCQICQRIYPYDDFMHHMKDCQQYQALLKQKKMIESKLVSIKQQQYDTRKSNMSSLNSSAIILNKSRSKCKLVKAPHNQLFKASHNQSNSTRNKERPYKQRRQSHTSNRNKTQRYSNKAQSDQNSRLQFGQILNISEISSRPNPNHYNNCENKMKKGLINPNNYFTSKTQSRASYNYGQDKVNLNYQLKPNPQIRYQTNILPQNSTAGKESMQQQIRKIVETLNQGGRSTQRLQINMKKQVQAVQASSNSRDSSLTSRNYYQKTQKQTRQERNQNYMNNNVIKTNRNRAQFY